MDRPPIVHRPDESKYGRQHHHKCLCEACMADFRMHQSQPNHYCQSCDWTAKEIMEADLRAKRQQWGGTMSAINVCDRCETMMTANAVTIVSIEANMGEFQERKEICPGCVDELNEFFANPVIGDRQKVYRTQYVPKNETTDLSNDELMDLGRKYVERLAIESRE